MPAAKPARSSAPNAEAAHADTSPVLLRETVAGGIAVLTLNRPKSRNTLSEAMLAALASEFSAIAKDRSVRAVVLAAKGPGFSGGHDLKELTAHRSDKDRGRAYFHHIMTTCSAMMLQIVRLPQPVIAAVQGIATAAGCQLVATCDLAVASNDAKFGVSGINAGLFCSTPMVALSRNVERKHAMAMLLTGDMISAEDACRIGLVNRVVPAGEERDAALALARKIAAKSAHVVKIGKQAFYRQLEMNLADAYRFTADVMVENMLANDAEEGIGAFIDKRAPKWTDK
jgi:enoyl-CoA hydratase/carnithine racemase